MINELLTFIWVTSRGIQIVFMPLPIGAKIDWEPQEIPFRRTLSRQEVD